MRKRKHMSLSEALLTFATARYRLEADNEENTASSSDLGNITVNGIEYEKTLFAPVTEKSIKITGHGSDGVFIDGRTVILSPYAIGKYQVTQELFKAVMGTNPSYFDSNPVSGETQERRPVEYVNWYQAIAFCNKLTLLTGGDADDLVYSVTVDGSEVDWASLAYSSIPTGSDRVWNEAVIDIDKNGYRLPTEAEWEFAARGGDRSDTKNWSYKYAGSDSADDVAWYGSNSGDKTHEVGVKTANALGIYDMSGNVWEWCQDWYGSITAGVVTDPEGISTGFSRVQRGGGWIHHASITAVSSRDFGNPYYCGSFGFRIARSL